MNDVRQQAIGVVDVQASIDRLTVLGKVRYIDRFYQYLRTQSIIKKEQTASYPYRTAFITVDDSYIAICGDDVKGMPNVRLDFNPNKLSAEGEKGMRQIVTHLVRPRLSRVDVAIDYFGQDMSNWDWHENRERKRQTIYAANGRLETLYLGSYKSADLIRIYDKGKEQKKDFDWWRVESQARLKKGDRLFESNPFEGLYAIQKGGEYQALPIEDKAMCYYLEREPSLFSQLTYYKRQKYRGMIKENAKNMEPTPADVFEKEKGNLLEQVAQWLKPANKK